MDIKKLGNVLKNSWWLLGKEFVNYESRSEEEASSGGDQLASNTIDTITGIKERQSGFGCLFTFISGLFYGLKNSFFVRKINIPFDKIDSVFCC